ncbi:MAG: helix-turn-helix transcriptional regulator [Oscillospiraceae bacterium]|nr:helix-turn-helix transcriptional regulator [Oscillospiraceae bacterium]
MKNIELNLFSIKGQRKIRSISLKKLSEATGINVKRLSKIEKRNDGYLSDIIKISLFFDLNERELYRYKIYD